MLEHLPDWLGDEDILLAVWNARSTLAELGVALNAAPNGEGNELYRFFPATWTGKYFSPQPRSDALYYEGVLRIVSADEVGPSMVTLFCEWQSTYPDVSGWGQMQLHAHNNGSEIRIVGAWTFVGAGLIGAVGPAAVASSDPHWSSVVLL